MTSVGRPSSGAESVSGGMVTGSGTKGTSLGECVHHANLKNVVGVT